MKTKTITLNGFIVFDQFQHSLPSCYPEGPYVFRHYAPDASSKDVMVQPHSITVDVPADFDPRPQMVKALEAQKAKAAADYQKTVTAINRQINELQAIECSAEAANA